MTMMIDPTPRDEPKSAAADKTPEQRLAEGIAFVADHDHLTAVADDSRESIYEGCGE
ncbi:MAG TPA: hypothetical protein VFE62_03185 [Gemmataceae bacterium]|nr:hypothetical protein [Gemmataceae bacterium]